MVAGSIIPDVVHVHFDDGDDCDDFDCDDDNENDDNDEKC